MESLKKPLIKIITFALLFALISEIIFMAILGFNTTMRGNFTEGLKIEGEIGLEPHILIIEGDDWAANFHNLSSIYIRYFDNQVLFDYNYTTSDVTIIPASSKGPSPLINFLNITHVSKFSSAEFTAELRHLRLTIPKGKEITGTLNTSIFTRYFNFHDIIVITEYETVEFLERGEFFLYGKNEKEIQFNISKNEMSSIFTYPDNGDIIELKGKSKAYGFRGYISSNGNIYFSGDPILSGNMEVKILHYPEKYYNHDSHYTDWELEIKGENVKVEGFGFPFWSIGLMVSSIPCGIIVYQYNHKKNQEEIEKTKNTILQLRKKP